MARYNLWIRLKDSAKAAEPYYGRLLAHYLLLIFCPVLVFFWVGFFIPIVVLIDNLFILEKTSRNSRQALLFLVVASPFVAIPVISLLLGLVGYVTGMGQPQRTSIIGGDRLEIAKLTEYRIERVTRRPWGTSVLGAMPLNFLTTSPYNLVLFSLSRVFGPMPGAYRGPYPDAEAAASVLSEYGIRWQKRELSLAKNPLQTTINPVSGLSILQTVEDAPNSQIGYDEQGNYELLIAPFHAECLIVSYINKNNWSVIVLIDRTDMKPFAWYLNAIETRRQAAEHGYDHIPPQGVGEIQPAPGWG